MLLALSGPELTVPRKSHQRAPIDSEDGRPFPISLAHVWWAPVLSPNAGLSIASGKWIWSLSVQPPIWLSAPPPTSRDRQRLNWLGIPMNPQKNAASVVGCSIMPTVLALPRAFSIAWSTA